MTAPKQPPPGVETTPTGRVVYLPEATERLGRDPRTVVRWIKSGRLRGGAIPRPERLRWYVYEDALPARDVGDAVAVDRIAGSDEVAELRAQLIAQREANRLLLIAQQELLEVDASTADRYRSIARVYLDALGQFMTPGHIGELTRDLS
ncbi:hypothetical protein [Mycolicibacterium sp.]|uniref:hypothetical protein n=1 Tax=Mycolicibacterium sp. TaxID=2320850 RepID=UPI0037C94D0B